jgi:pyruvate kinase
MKSPMALGTISGRRRTKIVCTIGPATASERNLRMLVRAGMDCARLNFSHGDLQEHLRLIKSIRKVERSTGKRIAILQDLPGPKFRIGVIPGGSIQLRKGAIVTLTTDDASKGNNNKIPLRSGENLPRFAPVGSAIFLSDGSIKLRVLDTTNKEIKCRCEVGGLLLSGKGVNVPELKHGFETFTKEDKKILRFGLEQGVDLVAVSFVRRFSDIESVRRFVRKEQKEDIPIVAKIEKKEALENIDDIVNHSDALMVARGDLGVENPLEEVPELQKQIISTCSKSGVPVITATQMLESMVNNPSPTRAEVTDVANAIFDGTDAVMLSEETAVGKYPVECVRVLDKVSLYAENMMLATHQLRAFGAPVKADFVSDAVGRAAASISNELGARAIVTLIDSMEPLCQISKLRPAAPIVAMSTNESRLRKLNIVWGVYPLRVDKLDSDAASIATRKLVEHRFLGKKERATLVCLDRGSSGKISMRMQVLQTDS